MELITLVKAGMKSRLGIFIGFMLLTMLMTVSIVTMIGVKKNYDSTLDSAFKVEDWGEIYGQFTYGRFDETMKKKLNDSDLVDHFTSEDVIYSSGTTHGEKKDNNSYNFLKKPDSLPVFNEDETGFINYINVNGKYLKMDDVDTELKSGEVYLPYGLKDKLDVKVGDVIKSEFLTGEKSFTVKGFVQEPYMGSNTIGIKAIFISDEDFDNEYEACVNAIETDDDYWSVGKCVHVFAADGYDKSWDVFARELNIETKFNDMTWLNITKETSIHYTGMFINIMFAVIIGVTILLLIVFLFIVGHSISSEIEIDYRDIGVLKSQGATSNLIRKVYIIEYLFAQFIGSVIGFIISIPCERKLSQIFFSMTALLPEKNIPVIEWLVISLGFFVVTGIFVYAFSKKVDKNSPVKAITNGRDDFYFDSRFNAGITKRGLGLSLGLRQITSSPKRYISIVVVSVLLFFAVITVELMSEYVTSRRAMTSMGMPFCEIEYIFNKEKEYKTEDIENIVEKYTDITGRDYDSHIYVSLNGESILALVEAYPNDMSTTYIGRDIKYDNEIIITEQVSKLLDINIGDTVTLGQKEKSDDYVIVGINQSMSDTGKCIVLSFDGYKKLMPDGDEHTIENLSWHGIAIRDDAKVKEIVKEIKDKYGDDIEIKSQTFEEAMESTGDNFFEAADATRILIYFLSFIFALITIVMVCTKMFIQERTNIGIERAVGFSVGKIRRQFAARFVIISIVSSVIGVILSIAFSDRVMEKVFGMFGVPRIEFEYTFMTFFRPVVVFVVVYMLFGYLASRKVKKVSARELISE